MSNFFLHLNSNDVDLGTSSDFFVDFERSGINFNDSEIVVGLDYVIMPNLIYPIRSGRNTIRWQEAGAEYSVIIPDGTYDETTFPTALKTALDAASTTPLVYTVSINAANKKLTVSATGNFQIKMASSANSPDIWRVIGFNYATNTPSAATQTGTMPARLDGDEFFTILCENFSSTSMSSSFIQRGLMDIIPLKNNFGDVIYHQYNETTNFIVANINELKQFRVRIIDSLGYNVPIADNCPVYLKFRVKLTQVGGADPYGF